MKLLSYILAFYLILLAAVPCCAIDNCPDDKTEQTASHENGDEDCGTCSPFFSCEGCATASIAFEPVQFDFATTISSSVYTQYQQSSLLEADLDFWQPPKLS
ncbi:MAG: hypothetical protein HOP10_12120 [Chitinophagaceae bacterium]|nr:hypothetical protein [Chitinophagaceae bacterium]